MEVRFIIEGRLDGLNDYTLANRRNRFAGASMKKKNEEKVGKAILDQLADITFDGEVFIEFLWVEQNRKRDLDNIAFAKKFILDSLTRTGVLKTDNWQTVTGFADYFEIDKDHPRIEVTIRSRHEHEN